MTVSRVSLRIAIVALVLAGCSAGAGASASPVATTTVDLPKSYKFVPPVISVDTGMTVTWTNNDNFTHNVAFAGDSPQAMKPGESVTRDFPEAGSFAYQCTLHPQNMQGTVIVSGG